MSGNIIPFGKCKGRASEEACSVKHDVAIKLYALTVTRYAPHENLYGVIAIAIEPTVGVDYPAVLGQMRAFGSNVLLVGNCTGIATREQFIKTFAMAGIAVVFLKDVERLANTTT